MGYAINSTAPSMRTVNGADDCLPGETYADELPTPWPPAPTATQVALDKIAALEVTVTDRRYREAVLGIDNGWLKNLNDQIAALRGQIK